MAIRKIDARKEQATANPNVFVKPSSIEEKPWSARLAAGMQMRVAAYCRVSTEQEEQQSSYESQVAYYTRIIQENQNWIYAGTYGDDGKTGTLIAKRKDFQRLLRDAEAGKMDLILCKSVSRFARNLLESIQTVRKLKALGVGVIFEKEGIDSRDGQSDMAFAIMASLAESDSQTLSTNVSWGYRRKFEAGSAAMGGRIYGYRQVKHLDEDGRPGKAELVVVQQEAEVVRKMFALCLDGMSIAAIAKEMTGEGIPTPRGKKIWSASTVDTILHNEKYMGDAICQKSYTVDPINKIRKENAGERPMYHILNHHTPIVSREVYDMVQQEMNRRGAKPKSSTKPTKTNRGRYVGKYALSDVLVCGKCGAGYKRCVWSRENKVVWRCRNRWENGKKYCPESPSLEENALQDAVMEAVATLAREQGNADAIAIQGLETAMGGVCKDGFDAAAAGATLEELNRFMDSLVQMQMESNAVEGYFEDKMQEIKKERDALQAQIDGHAKQQAADANLREQIEILRQILQKIGTATPKFSNALVHKAIEKIEVVDDKTIRVIFKGNKQPIMQIVARNVNILQ